MGNQAEPLRLGDQAAGRNHAGARGRHGRARGTTTVAPTPTRLQRGGRRPRRGARPSVARRVLELVQGTAHGSPEWGATTPAGATEREVRGQADRGPARRSGRASIAGRHPAHRVPLETTPGHHEAGNARSKGGRGRRTERTPQDGHGRWLARQPSPTLGRQPRSQLARRGLHGRPGRPTTVPASTIVPSAAPGRRRLPDERHEPGPRPPSRDGRTGRDAPGGRGVGLADEHGSIGKRMKSCVIPCRQPEAASGSSVARPIGPMNRPTARRQSPAASRGPCRASRSGPRATSTGLIERAPRPATDSGRWRIRAGPRMTMNSDGKMQPTSGKSILIGALRLFSSAAGVARCGAARTDLEHLGEDTTELLGTG